jgi:hypothetical protein
MGIVWQIQLDHSFHMQCIHFMAYHINLDAQVLTKLNMIYRL